MTPPKYLNLCGFHYTEGIIRFGCVFNRRECCVWIELGGIGLTLGWMRLD